jgi:PAS domain S-box-containing protein
MSKQQPDPLALRVSAIYGVVAAGYILFSDWLVSRFLPDARQISHFQTYKGLAFVGITAGLLYAVLSLVLRQRQKESADRRLAEALLNAQKQTLELIASGAPLEKTFETLLRLVERESPEMLCSILLLDEDGRHLRPGAAPSLPADLVRATNGIEVGPQAGSCGTAAFRREAVIVADIAQDPLWEKPRDAVLRHGLRACWSTPILDPRGQVLGTFAIYSRTPGEPTARHRQLIEAVTHTAAVAILRHREEEALRKSEQRYRTLTEQAADAFFVHDETGRILEVNRRACESLGYSREELLHMRVADVEQDHDQAAIEQVIRELPAGEVRTLAGLHQRKNGSRFPVEVRLGSFEAEGRRLFHALCRDITLRKRNADALELFRTLVDRVNDAIEVLDPETGRFLDLNEKVCADLGYTREELLSLTVCDVDPSLDPAAFKTCKERLWNAGSLIRESTRRRKDGSTFPVEVNMKWVWLNRDYMVAVVRDISERWKTNAALRRNEELFRSLIENGSDLITVLNGQGIIRFQSPSSERIMGYTPEQLVGQSCLSYIHPEDAPRVQKALAQAVGNPEVHIPAELRFRHQSGEWRTLQAIGKSIPGQSLEGFIVVNSRDITDTRKLEEQFRQSQKMEAIGQLAGGVAHDLNNILTVVHIQLDLLKRGEPLAPMQLESILDIEKASRRAADLTRQLLLFSRRQAAQKSNLDLNAVVTNITKMLQRILGEDVGIHISYAPQPLPVYADAGMLEQILMNLAVNSRDAMPTGGRLVIETSVVELDEFAAAQRPQARPGRFACLSVSDTGRGIAPENLPRIFEPFFTTKAVGKGTGLGLATVFGIAQQHNGWINAYSEAGKGSTFRLYLPLQMVAADPEEDRQTISALRGGSETILLVEDEQSLRVLTRDVLTRLGYRVLEATTGVTALDVWKEHRDEIRLLLTDLVMPDGVSGRELAKQLSEADPKLKVIYTSGYSRDVAGHNFPLQEGVNFLSKPFQAAKLAQTVRTCLEG